MRIFIGITEIAGYYGNLQKGFRDLGIACDFINLYESAFYHQPDEKSSLPRQLIRWVAAKNASTTGAPLGRRIFWKAVHTLIAMGVFLWALPRYDVFIFSYGITFLFFYDLPLLKFFKKKLVFVFNGSDTRPAYIGYPANRASGYSVEDCIRHARRQKRMVRTIERYADAVICHTLSAQFLEKPFVQFLCLGIPFQPPVSLPVCQNSCGEGVRVLHSPSNPRLKGTPHIRQAVANVQGRGYAIDYVEISGKPNAVVLQELACCNFVVDELYSDTPMAGLATEAAFFGKPTVTAGYARDAVQRLLPAEMIPPSLYCHPSEIESAIQTLAADRDYCRTLGEQARNFVTENWNPCRVAEKYWRIIGGDIPSAWLFDPKEIEYFLGAAAPEEDIRYMVRKIIEKAGVQALHLTDKPALERCLCQFALG